MSSFQQEIKKERAAQAKEAMLAKKRADEVPVTPLDMSEDHRDNVRRQILLHRPHVYETMQVSPKQRAEDQLWLVKQPTPVLPKMYEE